jgi:DNA-binding MarR family transcriptional regulator
MVLPINDQMEATSRLRTVILRLARELRREIHSLGVTGGQVTILNAIHREPGITASALAESERISPPAMSGHLVRLENAGLIARTRGADRRRMGLTVTAEGERVLRSVRKRRAAWLAARLNRLTADERAAVEAALEPLEKLLERDE